MKFKYNPVKNAKVLKEMEPNEVDKVLLWVFLLLGIAVYEFFPDKESLLGFLSFGLIYKFSYCIGWTFHWFIQAIYCKKHNLNFDGTKKVNNDEKES